MTAIHSILSRSVLVILLNLSSILPMHGANRKVRADRIHSTREIDSRNERLVKEFEKADAVLEYNFFEIGRSISDYFDGLGGEGEMRQDFYWATKKLRKTQLWIDFGAAEAKAILQYLDAEGTAGKVLGISYKRPPITKQAEAVINRLKRKGRIERFSYLEGRLVEDIPEGELGLADVETDLQGPLLYTRRLTDLLNVYFRSLKRKTGKFFAISSRLEGHATFIEANAGKMPLAEWIATLPGLDVKLEHVDKPEINEVFTRMEVVKTAKDIKVPKLELIEFMAGTPPMRTFRVVDE